MNILIADDELPKLSKIEELLKEHFPEADIKHARSVRSAIDSMLGCIPDLLILDMSLPTFDVGAGEPGGRPQGFGGIEVLRHMDFHEILSPVLVVTQYPAFFERGEAIDLETIGSRLSEEHTANFRGCIFYAPLNDEWRDKLLTAVSRVLGEGQT